MNLLTIFSYTHWSFLIQFTQGSVKLNEGIGKIQYTYFNSMRFVELISVIIGVHYIKKDFFEK